MEVEEKYMRRCLDLAIQGIGRVSPNPLVGAVVVTGDVILGEGYHMQYGGPHAEVNAIRQVKNPESLKHSKLFVNLEPCSHHGKTPPCVDLIMDSGISEVYIAHADPNPLVGGQGITRLRQAGVSVRTGMLEQEALHLNRRFIQFHREKRPYIILKWAQTRDGFIDIDRSKPGSNLSNWITNDSMKQLVHHWRSEEDAVLVGTKTAYNDDPRLTVREWTGRNPLRMVIDEDLSLPRHLKLFDQTTPTLVLTAKEKLEEHNISFLQLDFGKNIVPQLLDILYQRGIQSLMVEGGKELLDSFIALGLWDEIKVLEGDKRFGKGLSAPRFQGVLVREEQFERDSYRCFVSG